MDGFAVENMRGTTRVQWWSERLEDAQAYAASVPEIDPWVHPMTLVEAFEQSASRVMFGKPTPAASVVRTVDHIIRDIGECSARLRDLHREIASLEKVAA